MMLREGKLTLGNPALRRVRLAAAIIILLLGIFLGWLLRGPGDDSSNRAFGRDSAVNPASGVIPMGFIHDVNNLGGVDLSNLNDNQRMTVLDLLNRMPCLAGRGGITVARCRRDSSDCVTSQRMADFIIDAARKDMSRFGILVAVYNKALTEDYVPSRIDVSRTNLPDKELPALGPEGAPITVTVFYDYTGEISHKALRSIEQLRAIYKDKIRVVYWPAPRTRLRPQADRAARTALAAYKLGKFEIVHKMLLEKRGAAGEKYMEDYAGQASINSLAATADSNQMKNRLDRLQSSSRRLDIEFPPVIFVQGRRIRGGVPSSCYLMATVQEALVDVVRVEYKGLEERIAP